MAQRNKLKRKARARLCRAFFAPNLKVGTLCRSLYYCLLNSTNNACWTWSQTSICNLSLFGLPRLFTPSLFEWMCARVWWWKMPKVRKKERENNHTLNWQDSNSRFSDWTNSAAFTRLRLRNVLVFLRRNVCWSNVYPTITICVITASPSRSITLEIGFVWKETVVFVIIIIFFFTLFG